MTHPLSLMHGDAKGDNAKDHNRTEGIERVKIN
jgi:hypothetical protein